MLGMVVSGGVSGGHINPAVTVAVATVGKFPWWNVGFMYMYFYLGYHLAEVPHYVVAQYFGQFSASCVVFCVYWDS